MILAMDTSTDVLAICIHDGTDIVCDYRSKNKNQHSTRLLPAIARLLEEANITPKQLTKIVVGIGPGSYTGVRIGLTTAKTMGFSLNIPVVGISSLKALALTVPGNRYVCSFFDARRGRVYVGLYDVAGKEVLPEVNISLDEWLTQLATLDKDICFISPDLHIFKAQIIEKLGDRATFVSKENSHLSAGPLAYFGQIVDATNPHVLVPNYLRLVEAELKWLEKNKVTDDV